MNSDTIQYQRIERKPNMADVELSTDEIQAVIAYWRNRAAALEDRVVLLELALNRAKGATATEEPTEPAPADTEEE